MLELRPNCELCGLGLPASSADARICSYECTYCVECVNAVLANVCPTCGGGFAPRPIRPMQAYRDGLAVGLIHDPASERRRQDGWSPAERAALTARMRSVPPNER